MRSLLLPLGLVGLAFGAAAQEAAGLRGIVQQRLPDGSIVLTDRPQPGAHTLRSWSFAPEDDAAVTAAQARRAAARQESEAVSERIGRLLQLERERDLELELARTRAAQARAERPLYEAEAPRYAVGPYWIGWPRWPQPRLRPHPPVARPPFAAPPMRPGPVRPPRPGAMPPPGPNPNLEPPF